MELYQEKALALGAWEAVSWLLGAWQGITGILGGFKWLMLFCAGWEHEMQTLSMCKPSVPSGFRQASVLALQFPHEHRPECLGIDR